MIRKDNIIIPRWFLEVVEDTLRIENNINVDKNTGETCQDRNIKESLNGIRKLLNGEELTGGERLEKLHPSLPSNLDEAAKEFGKRQGIELAPFGKKFFKAGAEWMAGQDKEKIEQAFFSGYNECEDRMKKEFEKRAMAGEVNNTGYPTTIQLHTFDSSLKNGDKVNIIIMKQE